MLNLKIISPEKILFSGEVESVLVPGTVGEFEILKDHAPIISTLEKGRVVYTTANGKRQLNIQGGFVEVKRNEISLCVEM
ncbi:ATP synthase F1 subunit epsilon [Prevotella sp. oral taxon 376]|uniref:ATP synthase F1 subunit epsilon n=1 Tax=Prevotella sp. oral taxon 376 TaxID=712466 RepID=UPI000D1E5442|nr:ATP synthase F1 subunit epsilon [Prevotella sp. oral taxon 376]PTL32593.1 ATP synthase F1 subunit epsilon [Prevotella sp. oral taxon 376]